MSGLSKIRHLYFATIIAFGIVVGTGLIPALGKWYSPSLPLRRQTEALLHGHVALSYSPAFTEHDMVWANGAVQQVWGLGIPVWRLPFEALANLCGQQTFPDRLALLIAWVLVIYLLLRTFLKSRENETDVTEIGFIRRNPERLAIVLLFALFPPILTLCRGPFQVYEEAIVYGYLYAVGLFAALIAFARRPRWPLYLVICGLSGLAGFIRPTIACYGVATVMLAFVYSRKSGWAWAKSIGGLGLFAAGGALLFWSNCERFGSGLEFGHNLNLTYADLIYTSRFHAPFQREPWWSAAREMLGALFWVKHSSDVDPYASGIIAFQSSTPRWRQFYETTFDFGCLGLALLCWGIFCSRLILGRRRTRPELENSDFVVSAMWSLSSLVPLFGFYLHFHAIACRYMMDFAPGMAAAGAGTLIAICGNSRRRPLFRWSVVVALALWWMWEVPGARMIRTIPAVTKAEALSGMAREPVDVKCLPDTYVVGISPSEVTGIPLNGRGWNTQDGSASAVVALFVNEPSRVILKVSAAEEHSMAEARSEIEAKTGLEFLKLESVKEDDSGAILTFSSPKQAAYRKGIQVVFLSFASTTDFMKKESAFRLLEVKCVTDESRKSIL